MEVIHPRCAGIDVSKRDAKVCVRVAGRGRKATSSTVTTWTSMASSILALREYLIAERVTCVVVESTAAYWKPFYFLLDDALNVMLVNARHFRNVPGRASRTANASCLAATITPGITCSASRTVAHLTRHHPAAFRPPRRGGGTVAHHLPRSSALLRHGRTQGRGQREGRQCRIGHANVGFFLQTYAHVLG
jgi:hypothetical protein